VYSYLKWSRIGKSGAICVIVKCWGLFHVGKIRKDFDELRHSQIQMNFRIPPWFVNILVCIDPHRQLVLWWQRQWRGVFTDTQIF